MARLYRIWRAALAGGWRWFQGKARSRHSLWWLGVYSFLHSILMPVPTDFLIVPMALAARARAALFVAVASATATLGAAAGYLAALLSYDSLVLPLIARSGIMDEVAALAVSLDQFTFAATLVTAVTPIPDLPVILAAGLLKMDAASFLAAYAIGRVIRLGGVTAAALFGIDLVGEARRFFTRI